MASGFVLAGAAANVESTSTRSFTNFSVTVKSSAQTWRVRDCPGLPGTTWRGVAGLESHQARPKLARG